MRKTLFLKLNERVLRLLRMLLLAALIFFGILLGVAAAGHTATALTEELNGYLAGYLRLGKGIERSPEMFFSTALAYFRFPVLAVLLGFASLGVVLIPLLCVVLGFLPAFSVSCLAISFGKSGTLLAIGMVGLRVLVTVFCFLLLAVPALESSVSLAGMTFGYGRRVRPVVFGRDWWLRVLLCAVLLITAMCLDLLLSPGLLNWLAERYL